ncbi:MAG TPA: response regulator transcription factor [Mycobacteriales bacterium]|nr:response regulator transcription factor [Mycobacteriales bacterium]
MSIRVLIADDQTLVRAGFRMIIEDQPDMAVVAEAQTGSEAIALSAGACPDVVLMDIRMPGLDGIEATRRLARRGRAPRVVMLTTYDLDEYLFDALSAGASGFLLKDVPPEDLVHAIRVTSAGDALLVPALTRRLIEQFVRSRPVATDTELLGQLTDRERDVLRLIARGRTNTEIAADLYLGESTIKTHIGHILEKLQLRDRVQAVILAYETGLVQPGHPPAT